MLVLVLGTEGVFHWTQYILFLFFFTVCRMLYAYVNHCRSSGDSPFTVTYIVSGVVAREQEDEGKVQYIIENRGLTDQVTSTHCAIQ